MKFKVWDIEETVGKVKEGGQKREVEIEREIWVSPALMEGPLGVGRREYVW